MLEVSDQGTSMVEFWWNSSSELQTTNQSLDSSSVSSRGSLASFCYAVLSHSVPSNSLQPHGLQPARILCPWDSPGKNTGVGCQFHLQGIFPAQGSNPGFLHCRLILLTTKPPGKSKNTGVGSLSLLWGPCWPRNWTRDSCIVGGFFYQLSYLIQWMVIGKLLWGKYSIRFGNPVRTRWDTTFKLFGESARDKSANNTNKALNTKHYNMSRASPVAQRLKRLPAIQETRVRSLSREDPLEKEMATHSSILAWRIPWTEEPSRLQSMGSQRVRHDWATSLHFTSLLHNMSKGRAL